MGRKSDPLIRSHLKNRILVQDRGGAEFQTGGILLYVEDLKRGTNPAEKGGRPKDIFEIASSRTRFMAFELLVLFSSLSIAIASPLIAIH